MKTYSFGDIIITSFPFSVDGGSKKRPALILIDSGDDDLIIALITSKNHQSHYDVPLNDWHQTKLLFPSTVRVHKLLTAEKSTILGRLGKVSQSDLANVKQTIQKLWQSL